MGIPAYMSYIIKNYSNIINTYKNQIKNNISFDCLYMDCNSIIYDVYNQILKEEVIYDNIEKTILLLVIQKIEHYISIINPKKGLIIAFDGVAPLAKMEQQRTRRYKSWHMTTFGILKEPSKKYDWSTSSITPGTKFMNTLSATMKKHFTNKEKKYNIKKIIVTGSDEVGEGEHKIFQYIRDTDHIQDNVFVYGLDSDLIMLSIFHYNLCNNIYVFREEFEFKKSNINVVAEQSELMFLNIQKLSESILMEMGYNHNDKNRIYDYILMCFLLGNDFLPHTPSLNLRTNGIQHLLETYKKYIGKYNDRFLIYKDTNKIQWKWFKLFIEKLAEKEHLLIMNEYALRNKMDNYKWHFSTEEEKENLLKNVPIIYRAEEKYICPTESMWEERYYKTVFSLERTHENVRQISMNYLEGIEWVFKYYTDGCPNWKWRYHYNYPPLLTDLLKYIPDCSSKPSQSGEIDFISPNDKKTSFSPLMQLSYVLPYANHYLLGDAVKKHLNTHYSEYYPEEIQYKWTFCRYFFESHVMLPEMPLDIMEKIEKEILDLYR